MRIEKADLFTYQCDAACITTNGFIKANGEAVMGRGCALEAAQAFPNVPKLLGALITSKGNRVHQLLMAKEELSCLIG